MFSAEFVFDARRMEQWANGLEALEFPEGEDRLCQARVATIQWPFLGEFVICRYWIKLRSHSVDPLQIARNPRRWAFEVGVRERRVSKDQ